MENEITIYLNQFGAFDAVNYANFLKRNNKRNQLSGALRDSITRYTKFIVQREFMVANYGKMFCVACNKVSDNFSDYQFSHIVSNANSDTPNKNWTNMLCLCAECNFYQGKQNLDLFLSNSRFNVSVMLANLEANDLQKDESTFFVLKRHFDNAVRDSYSDLIRYSEFSIPE